MPVVLKVLKNGPITYYTQLSWQCAKHIIINIVPMNTPPNLDLLANLPCDIVSKTPYPHLVARDVLPADLVARLNSEFPSLDRVAEGKPTGSNQRFSYAAHKALANPDVSETWKQLVADQLTQGFLDHFVRLFGDAIQQRFPDFASRFGEDLRLRAGVRRRGGFAAADVLLESQISVNTPVIETTSVRGPHIDMPDKLFAGLFYLRHPDDDSQGGDLQIHRYRNGNRCLRGQFIDEQDVEVVDTVSYQSNVLVLFLNGADAIHGVTPRQPTQYPRLFLNLFGELQQPLFDLNRYQRDQSVANRAHYRLLMGQKRLVRGLRSVLHREQ